MELSERSLLLLLISGEWWLNAPMHGASVDDVSVCVCGRKIIQSVL